MRKNNRREGNRSNQSRTFFQDRERQGRFGNGRNERSEGNYDRGNYGRGGYGSYDDNMGYGSGTYERENPSARGYGNDPESFENSYGRGHGYPGRRSLESDYDRYYQGPQSQGSQSENRGGQNQGSTWGFGRSWNANEDDFNTHESRGGSMNSGNGNRYDSNRGTSIGGNWGSGSMGDNEGFTSNRGKGPKGYQRSDERIQEDINDQLSEDDEIDASEIEVKVERGEVTLSGSVNERNLKRMAEDIAESVSGVKNVENRIRITDSSRTDSSHEQNSRSASPTSKSNDRSKLKESMA